MKKQLTIKQIKSQLEIHKNVIAKERDKMRLLLEEFETFEENLNYTYECLDDAINKLSETI